MTDANQSDAVVVPNQQDTALLPVEHWERMIREAAEAEAERENEAEGHCGSYGTSTWKDYEKDVRKDFEDIGRAFAALAQSAEAGEVGKHRTSGWPDGFYVEYDDGDDDFTICWPDGRYLVAHRSGTLITGQSPQSLGVEPVRTTITAFRANAPDKPLRQIKCFTHEIRDADCPVCRSEVPTKPLAALASGAGDEG